MPKLILSMDGLVLKEIALDRERTTIGRKPSNDIQIDNLAISGEHAVITTILDDAFLEDRNSTNGTYVNGQPIKKHVLHNNDVVELGKYRLKYIADTPRTTAPAFGYAKAAAGEPVPQRADAAPAAAPAAGSSAPQPPAAAPTETAVMSAVAASAANAGGDAIGIGVIRVLSGPNAGRELELSKAMTKLGKPGKQVAAITRRLHGYYIAHVEGDAFPRVNGVELDARAHRLGDRDVVEVASVTMEFFMRS